MIECCPSRLVVSGSMLSTEKEKKRRKAIPQTVNRFLPVWALEGLGLTLRLACVQNYQIC